jgi:hypothetical protein
VDIRLLATLALGAWVALGWWLAWALCSAAAHADDAMGER